MPVLSGLPGRIVAIDGRDGSGKTTLGRFLAWYFNITLIETDLYLKEGGELQYETAEINRIISKRLTIPRPVVIEGVAILQLLAHLDRRPDYLVYVRNSSFAGSDSLLPLLASYERAFKPQMGADLLLDLSH